MRHIIIGLGSIGQRHLRNLRSLRPEDEFVTVDTNGKADYLEFSYHLERFVLGSLVYICTPFDLHRQQYYAAYAFGAKGIFVEKPLHTIDSLFQEMHGVNINSIPFAIGFNHRFHPLFRRLYSLREQLYYFHLYGSENISAKYGDTALETMLSHSLDLGLWFFGDYESYTLIDSGIISYFRGVHRHSPKEAHIAAVSMMSDMLSMYRVAICAVGYANPLTKKLERHIYEVKPDDQMYIDEMKAWLNYVETGDVGDLCTFQQALKVQEIMNNRNRGEIKQ